MSEKGSHCQRKFIAQPDVQTVPLHVRKSTSAALTLTWTASTLRNIRHMQLLIGHKLTRVRMLEASWASPVTIKDSFVTTRTLQCCFTWLAPLHQEKGTLGSDAETRWGSGAIHSPGRQNACMNLTLARMHSAMLLCLHYRTQKPNIACTLMLANMYWAWCSPRYKIRQRGYWVILATNYMTWRHDMLHITEHYWVSEMRYHTGNSTYTVLSSHLWYTQTMLPCIGSSHNNTSLYVRWISWQSSRI